MSTAAFLASLRRLDVRVWADGDRLRASAPKGVLTPSLRHELTARKAEILTLLRHATTAVQSAVPPIHPVSRAENLPLSFAQQRLWFLEQFEPGLPLYHISRCINLEGELNVRALEHSLNAIVRRHEALRTTFVTQDGQPVQVIHASLHLEMPVVDLRTLPDTERHAAMRRLALHEAQRPFDLTQGPLLRTCLLQASETSHVLVLTMHHIVTDGWSMRVFFRELGTLYEAFVAGNPSPLAPLPIQYADIAQWQRTYLQGEVLARHLAYWTQQLDALPALNLPTDRPRPAAHTYTGAIARLTLPSQLSAALKALAQHEHVTLFMVLLGAFHVLLHRYAGQDDIVVGVPIAGRTQEAAEHAIGFFVNTLVLRVNVSGNPSFRSLLGRVKQVALSAYTHQELPFEKLVDAMQPERSLSHAPLFQVLFQLQDLSPTPALDIAGLSLSVQEVDRHMAKHDLALHMEDTAAGLTGGLAYNTDLFDAATMSRMLAHFQTLLESIVANPDQGVSALSLFSQAEQYQILVEWNNTATDDHQDTCIHHLFEEQVKQTPEAVAVGDADASLTYRELNHRSNQLAHHLRALDVRPEVLVGICMERSVAMMVAILGILKAGGAYVALDPDHPQDRLAFLLADAQPPVLLTQQGLVHRLPAHEAQVICLDSGWDTMAHQPGTNPTSGVRVDNLAYVLYTSGSTGGPKGVTVAHRPLCNYTVAIVKRFHLTAGSRFAMVQPLTVDSCITVIFASLVIGGYLHLVSRERALDPEALADDFEHYGIDCLKIAPSHLAALQASPRPERYMPRRCLVIGGEESRWSWVKSLQALAPDCSLFNHYGPTETTVGVLTYQITQHPTASEASTTPLGRPLANTQVYVLDAHLQPVPVGVPGELYVGGVALARGYLKRPALTAERFMPNPFSHIPGARLYKTGDMARYLPDGTIAFLGRLDQQVKVRGFRIELGEIDAVLSQHPDIERAVVTVREDRLGDKRLVAYVVFNQAAEPRIGVLHDYVKSKLPEYMVPSAFVILDELPLTPHGKLDRQALPAPDGRRTEPEPRHVAPRTSVEKTLAGIWAEVLRLERVGRHDNFFELGGDSILSMQIIARANQAGLRLTPKQMFQHQTIAELAPVADHSPAYQAEQGLVSGTVPLTPIQQWFFEQQDVELHHANQSVWLEVRQGLDLAWLEQAVQHVMLHHDALRLRFVHTAAGWQQSHAQLEETLPVSRVDVSALSEVEQAALSETAVAAWQASLNLAAGPLLRVVLFERGQQKAVRLLMVVHHLVVDGVSWRILLADLWTAYDQLSQKQTVRLPAKTTSLQQWSQGLRVYAQSTALRSELAYWLTALPRHMAHLPVDSCEAANLEGSADTVTVSLSIDDTEALLREVPRAYRTQINDILLTALVQAFSRWTGAHTLLVTLEGHGREEIVDGIDLSRTVGWFTSRFPVCLDVAGAEAPGEALKTVKEQLRQIPNRGLGYGVLRYLSDDAAIAERLSALPQPEVSFNYLGQVEHMLPPASTWVRSWDATGPQRSPKGQRSHLISVNGCIAEAQLQLRWTYSKNWHRRLTIECLAGYYVEALQTLIRHCQASQTGGYTPSDFPEAGLSQDELDALLAQLREPADGA